MECGNVQIAFGFHTCQKVNFACMFFQRLTIAVCGLRLHCLQTSSEVDICRALWSYTSLANFIKSISNPNLQFSWKLLLSSDLPSTIAL